MEDDTVGEAQITNIESVSNGDGTHNLTLYFNRTNGVDTEIDSWRLDITNTQDGVVYSACDDTTLKSGGMDLGSANFDSSLGGEVDKKTQAYFVFNSDYDSNPDNSQIGGGSDTIEGLLVQASGSYTAKVTIYEKDKCKTTEDFDESNVYGFDLNDPATGLDHYAVSYDGGSTTSDVSGSTCTAIPVTIVAHDISDSAVTATTTVTLTTSSDNGIWVANGTSSIDLTFGGATSVTTYLRHTTAEPTTINVTDGSVTESASEDPTLTTSAVGLVITGPGNIVSGLNVDNSTSLTIAEDCTTSGTLATTFYYSCLDPNSCIVGQDLTINDVSISNNSSSPTAVALTYTSGSSTFDVNFEDAGQVQLFANVTVTASAAADASGSWATNTTFVSKPATLSISVAGNSGTEGSGSGFTPAMIL